MVLRGRSFARRLLPHGPGDVLRQILLFGLAYYAYQLARGAVGGDVWTATWNATKVIHVENSLHIFVEPSVQAWATSSQWLIDATDWMYLNLHFEVTIGGLIFIYLFRNDSFYFVRNMFLVAMAIALVGYVGFPTAPPRLMPEWGFTDSVREFTGVTVENQPVSALLNLYAAVPSMHVCMALMVGWPLARLVRPRALKVFWCLYPLLIAFVVVATGNHYIFDVVLGALTAAVSALAAQRLARARPGAWGFGSERAGARA